MIKKYRSLLAASTAMILAAGLAACAPSSDGGGSDAASSDVSLRVIVYTSNPDQLALLDSIAEGFVEQNPEVSEVKFESISATDLDTKLTAELGTSEAPDASWMTVVNSRRYMDAGALVNLAPALSEAEGYDVDDLIPSLTEEWTDGESVYGVPFSTSTQVLYYNSDMFRAAGVATPDEMIEAGTWDWENYRKAAAVVADSQGVPAYAPTFDNVELLFPLMYAYEASPWNAAADKCMADSDEMVDALSLLHDMMYIDKSTTVPGQSANVFDGSAASSIAYLSSASLLADASFEWGVVPTPDGPTGSHPTVGQSAFVAFEKGNHPELASKLVAHLTNAANAGELAAHWVPSRESLLTAEQMSERQPLLTVEQFEPIIDGTISSGKIVPVSRNGGAAQGVFLTELNEHVFTPGIDVSSALAEVCGPVQDALESR